MSEVEIGTAQQCAKVDVILAACERECFTAADYAWLAVVAASKVIKRGRPIAELASTLSGALSP